MPDLMDKLGDEVKALARAPLLAALALVVAVAVVWTFFHWSYGALIADRNAHIESLGRRLAEYRDRLQGATADEARARIDALETEVKELRIKLNPRHLTPVQRQALIDHSRLPGGTQPYTLTVAHEAACGDCAAYAAEIVAALRESGSWIVSTDTLADLPQRPRRALSIRIGDPLSPSAGAAKLQRALRLAGLPFDTMGGGTADQVELLVTDRSAK